MGQPAKKVIDVQFGGSGDDSSLTILQVFAVSLAVQPSINATALVNTIRSLANTRTLTGEERIQLIRLADLISEAHASWLRGMEELARESGPKE